MKNLFWLLLAAVLIIGLFMMCQDKGNPPAGGGNPAPALYPGEVQTTRYREPIVVDTTDLICSTVTDCPSHADDCSKKTFTVQKDTTYRFYAVYFNNDTLTASCRMCVTIYEQNAAGNVLTKLDNLVTACPTGGPWQGHVRLVPGKTYVLSACLQKCPDLAECKCGEVQYATAIVSIRDLLPELRDQFVIH